MKTDINEDKEKVQSSMEINEQKLKNLRYLCELIDLIIAEFEINRFKAQKLDIYYETI